MVGEYTQQSIEDIAEMDLSDPQQRDLAAKYNIDSVTLDYLEMEDDPAAKAAALAQHAEIMQDWAASAYGEEDAAASASGAAGAQASAAGTAAVDAVDAGSETGSVYDTLLTGSVGSDVSEDADGSLREQAEKPSVEADTTDLDALSDEFSTEDESIEAYELPDSVGEAFEYWDGQDASYDDVDAGVDAHPAPDYDMAGETGEAVGDMFETWDSKYGDSAESTSSTDGSDTGRAVDGSVSMDTDVGPASPASAGSTDSSSEASA